MLCPSCTLGMQSSCMADWPLLLGNPAEWLHVGCVILQRSLLYLHYLLVRWAPECKMHVTISERTTSGEHKVKVTSLVVSDDVADTGHVMAATDAAIAMDEHGLIGRRLLLS